jgi:hypothetical protein
MRGHKVIESLNKEITKIKKIADYDNGGSLDFVNDIIKDMRRSIHFYFEPTITIKDMTDKMNSEEFIQKVVLTFQCLPYDTMWVEYKVIAGQFPKNKITTKTLKEMTAFVSFVGVLIKRENDQVLVRVLIREKNKKRWVPGGFKVIIDNDVRFTPSWDLSKTMPFSIEAQYAMQWQLSNAIIQVDKLLNLLNCKNIVQEAITPPSKLQKKRKANFKQPLFSYHLLKIKAPGRKHKQGETKDLYYNRIHLCRGHFKEYTKEAPLFGKYTGTYWWQPSVRGNKDRGVIHKDYEVATRA